MLIIGVDYHPSFQQIAFADTVTGECGERRLTHSNGDAERFYLERKMAGTQVRAGTNQPDTPAGSNKCSQSLASSCGSETPAEFGRSECESRRQTVRTHNFC